MDNGVKSNGGLNEICVIFYKPLLVMVSLNKDNINTKIHFLKLNIGNEKEKYEFNFC